MSWEQRGANQYYYRKERNGSHVKSVYVGRGEVAHFIAEIQSSSATFEGAARRLRTPEIKRLDSADAVLDRAIGLIRLITEATFLTAGFHTHKRQWRKKRNGKRVGIVGTRQ